MTIDDVLNKMSKSGFTDARIDNGLPVTGHLASGRSAALPGVAPMPAADLLRMLYALAKPERWNAFITCQSVNLASLPLTERSAVLVRRTVYAYRAFGDFRYRITATFKGTDLSVEILQMQTP